MTVFPVQHGRELEPGLPNVACKSSMQHTVHVLVNYSACVYIPQISIYAYYLIMACDVFYSCYFQSYCTKQIQGKPKPQNA